MKISLRSFTYRRSAMQQQTFLRVLPTRWRRKPSRIDMNRNYVTTTLCISYDSPLILFFFTISDLSQRVTSNPGYRYTRKNPGQMSVRQSLFSFDLPGIIIEKRAKKFKDDVRYPVCVCVCVCVCVEMQKSILVNIGL